MENEKYRHSTNQFMAEIQWLWKVPLQVTDFKILAISHSLPSNPPLSHFHSLNLILLLWQLLQKAFIIKLKYKIKSPI